MTASAPSILEQFITEAKRTGSLVYQTKESEEVIEYIMDIAKKRNLKSVVKSRSSLALKLGLRQELHKQGLDVKETDIGEWIDQISGANSSQNNTAASPKSLEEVAKTVSRATGTQLSNSPEKLAEIARSTLREYYITADIGISEAELGVAETGTCILASNEGNDRLVSLLPKIHVTLLGERNILATWEDAIVKLRELYKDKQTWKMPSFITYLTGRNTTGDIPGALMARAQGPEEEHIILVDIP